MSNWLNSRDMETGPIGFVVVMLAAPHVVLGWRLTEGHAVGTIAVAILSFFGSVHIWRNFWNFVDRWRQLQEREPTIVGGVRTFFDALIPPEWEPPGFMNPAPVSEAAVKNQERRLARAANKAARKSSGA